MDAAIADTVWLLYCLRHYGADLCDRIADLKKEKNGIDVKRSGGLRTAWHSDTLIFIGVTYCQFLVRNALEI